MSKPCETCEKSERISGERFCKTCKKNYLAAARKANPIPEREGGWSEAHGRKGRGTRTIGGEADMRDYWDDMDDS